MEKEGKAERENASKLRPSTKGHTMPIQKAVEIQKALKPLGYVVLGFEKEGLEFSLRLGDGGGSGLPWYEPVSFVP